MGPQLNIWVRFLLVPSSGLLLRFGQFVWLRVSLRLWLLFCFRWWLGLGLTFWLRLCFELGSEKDDLWFKCWLGLRLLLGG